MIYIIFSLLVQAASIFGAGGYPDQNSSQGSYPNPSIGQSQFGVRYALETLFAPTEDAPTLQSQGYQNQAPSFVPARAPNHSYNRAQIPAQPQQPLPQTYPQSALYQPYQQTTTNYITQNFGPTFNTFNYQPVSFNDQLMRVNVDLGTTPSTSQFYNQPQIPTHTYQPQSQSFFQPQQPIPAAYPQPYVQAPLRQPAPINYITQNYASAFTANTLHSKYLPINFDIGTTPTLVHSYNQPQIPDQPYQTPSQNFAQTQQPMPQAPVYQPAPINHITQNTVTQRPVAPSQVSERDAFQNALLSELFGEEFNNNGFPGNPHDRQPPASNEQPPLKKVALNQNPEIQFQSKFFANPTEHKPFCQAFKIQLKNVNPPAPQQTAPRPIDTQIDLAQFPPAPQQTAPRPIGTEMNPTELIAEISYLIHASNKSLPLMSPIRFRENSNHEQAVLKYIFILSYCYPTPGWYTASQNARNHPIINAHQPQYISYYCDKNYLSKAITQEHIHALSKVLKLSYQDDNKTAPLHAQISSVFKKFIQELATDTNAHFGVRNYRELREALASTPKSPEILFEKLDKATFYIKKNTSTRLPSNNSGCSGEVIDMKLNQFIEKISDLMHASNELPFMGSSGLRENSNHEQAVLKYIFILSYCYPTLALYTANQNARNHPIINAHQPQYISHYFDKRYLSKAKAITQEHIHALSKVLKLSYQDDNKTAPLHAQISSVFKQFIQELATDTNAHFGVRNYRELREALESTPESPEILFEKLDKATFYIKKNTSTRLPSNQDSCSGEVIEIEDEEDEQDPDGGNTTQGNPSGNNTPVATSGNSSSKTKQTQSTTSTSQTQTGNTRQNISSNRFFDLYVQMLRQERQAQQQAENNERYTRYNLDRVAENELNAIVDLHKENEIPAAFVYLAQLQTAYTTLQTTAYNTLVNHINHFAYAAILLALQQRHAVQNDIGCVPFEIF